MQASALRKVREVYAQFGVALRGVLVAAAIGLVFLQGPPKERVGAKRKTMNPQQVKKVIWVLSGLMVPTAVLLLFVHHFSLERINTFYPASAGGLVMLGFLAGMMRGSLKKSDFGLGSEMQLNETQYSLNFKTTEGGYVNIPNPDRGLLVLGGAGAGKSYSIGEPLIEQFVLKGRCGLTYDYKFPTLAAAMQKALITAEPVIEERWKKAVGAAKAAGQPIPEKIKAHFINFSDLTRTEKVNPFRAQDMLDMSYAMEYAQTLLDNLGGAKSGGDNFFDKSAYAFFTSIIWFYRNNYPQFCTIPHVVATALYPDLSAVLSMLQADTQSADLAQSLMMAMGNDAGRQLAGVVASLQVDLVRINTPAVAWVLTPDEERGEGFSLNLNNPLAPKLLTIGNDPTLQRTFSPVIACVVATCLKLMNQQKKQPSFVFLDEAATIYIPDLEQVPATARSNRVAMCYMTQDLAQMTDKYGQEKMKVMVANLNNQAIGKVNNLETARYISDMIGREDREMLSVSSGKNQGGKGGQGMSENNSVSLQERNLIRPQDIITLQQGEFVGQTVETQTSFFKATIQRKELPGSYPIEPLATFDYGEAENERIQIELNVAAIAQEAVEAKRQAESGSSRVARRRQTVAENYRRTTERETRATNAMEAIIQRNYELIKEEVVEIITQFPNLVREQQEREEAQRQTRRRAEV